MRVTFVYGSTVGSRSWAIALVTAIGLFYSQPSGAAEKDDSAAIAAIDKIVTGDLADANFGEAKKKLKAILDRCKNKCSAPVIARAHVAAGMVAAQINQTDEAQKAFIDAFNGDPNAALPAAGVTPPIKAAFDAAQKKWIADNPQPDDAQKAGFVSKQAFDLAKLAIQAEAAGNFSECVDKDKAALTIEEQMRTRMHLAQCEAKALKIIDALRDNVKAMEAAKQKGDLATVKVIQDRVTELLPRVSHAKFELPNGVTDLKISFDERAIPPNRFTENFTIDPGTHAVHAEGILRGARVSFDQKVEVKETETAIIKITLKPAALTQAQLECLVSAKTQEEAMNCVGPAQKSTLVAHARLDMSGYNDSYSVEVLTPSLTASVSSPTAGWNVGASYLIDMLTAASPDVTSTASPHFKDTRNAVTLTGGYKPDRWGAQLFGAYSTEADYISRTLGLSLTGDFMEKQITPRIGYAHSQDTVGRAGTSYDVFSRDFGTEEFTAGSTFVMSRVSVLAVGGTFSYEHGDQSKPYRYIPMFDPGVNPPAGASYADVNAQRLPLKPLEQLPLERMRYAIAARYIWRIKTNATLRVDERLYDDSWGIRATTTDSRYMIDVSPRFRIWPHAHLHAQTGAIFYQRVYGATPKSDGSSVLPQYRTSDRELSPFIALTGGGGARFSLTDPSSGRLQVGLVATVDALFDYYLNTFYVRSRLGEYSTLGVEADFE
jgi:hypothetical protein